MGTGNTPTRRGGVNIAAIGPASARVAGQACTVEAGGSAIGAIDNVQPGRAMLDGISLAGV